MEQDKTRTYIFYALGEIFLVVVGILIALQVNNWNEERKKEHLRIQLINSLIADFEQDKLQLNNAITTFEDRVQFMNQIQIRLERNSASTDSVLKIARYEFSVGTKALVQFNRNTFEAVISNGNLDLIELKVQRMMNQLFDLQDQQMKYSDGNLEVYIDAFAQSRMNYPNQSGIINRGKLYDELWKSIDKNEFVHSFNALAGSDRDFHGANLFYYNLILPDTEKVIAELKKLMD